MTASADVTRLMSNVRNQVPGVLDGAVQLEMFNVVTDFLQKTKAWQEGVDFPTIVNTTDYVITTVAIAAKDSLMYVLDATCAPVQATMAIPGTVSLHHEPSSVQTLTARFALATIDPVDGDGYPVFPAWLLTKYSQTFWHGIVGALMMQPAKPYTNQQLGIYNTRMFKAGTSAARVEVRHQNLYNGQTWRFPAFASGRQR